MEKLTMIIWHSPDYCINCKSNSLRVVTDKGHSTSVLEVDMSNKFKIYKKIVCSKCGKVIEVEDDLLEELEKDIQKKYNFKIKDHSVKFFGLCSECRDDK